MEPLHFEVFIENTQGATTKIHLDEEKLVPLFEEVRANIAEHLDEVFSHDPNRTLRVGRLLPAAAAEALVRGEQLPAN